MRLGKEKFQLPKGVAPIAEHSTLALPVIGSIMSAIKHRRGQSLRLELPNGQREELPKVAALFLIIFDVKAGYTISWKRSLPGCLLTVDISDSVEFRSLPSGLHNIQDDLVYFVHEDEFAGISAFTNKPAVESERNALMLAVGALLPLSYGRLGKSWKHAEGLKELAQTLAKDPTNAEPLEQFWEEHQYQADEETSSPGSPEGSPSALRKQRSEGKRPSTDLPRSRGRAVSTASALATPGQGPSPNHPALSLSAYLDTFGPLVFPLYKAALLRKRILLVCQAPVELACNFVYDASILSTLPSALHSIIPLSPLPARLRPLFSVGVHDISTLSTGSRTSRPSELLASEGLGYGWVACTTDDILTIKDSLYDTLVTIPPRYTKNAKEKVWPRIQDTRAADIKATQRDARRYRTLRRDLRRSFPASHSTTTQKEPTPNYTPAYPSSGAVAENGDAVTTASEEEDTQPLLPLPSLENENETFDDASSTTDEMLLEPQSWSALAYNSFMWWASAGEKRTDFEEESDFDSTLLHQQRNASGYTSEGGGGGGISPGLLRRSSSKASPGRPFPAASAADDAGGGAASFEMTLIGYFHHLTTLIIQTLGNIIDASTDTNDDDHHHHPHHDEGAEGRIREEEANNNTNTNSAHNKQNEDQDQEETEPIFVSSEDMARMGLDVWSEADRQFVIEMVDFYWGRRCEVQGGRIECCGVRVG